MYKNPTGPWQIGYNAGFKAHEKHVAEGQIKRIEAEHKEALESLEQLEKLAAAKMYKEGIQAQAFEAFKTLLDILNIGGDL